MLQNEISTTYNTKTGQDWKIAAIMCIICVCFFVGKKMNDIEYIKKELIKLANKAYKQKEIPVGALIIRNGKIVAKAYNKRNKTNNPLHHAEILCIINAAKKQKYWRLNEYVLYVTLEPCEMCKKIIEECGIKEVHYFINSKNMPKKVNTIYHKENDDNYHFKTKLDMFFKNIRKEQK